MRYSQKVLQNESKKTSSAKRDRNLVSNSTYDSLDKWKRPSDWLPMPTISSSEEKVAILVYIKDFSANFIAFTCAGNYNVDWGDGSSENVSSGVKAEHEYTYSDGDLNSTVTTDGFKMAIIIITPQGGANLTSVNFTQVHSACPQNEVMSPIWEIKMSCPNVTSFGLGNSTATSNYVKTLVFFEALNLSSFVSTSYMFAYCESLKYIKLDLFNPSTGATMFSGCYSLKAVSLFNTLGMTNMTNMFSSCSSLTGVPLFDTRNITTMSGMFNGCLALESVPAFNTSLVNSMASMFSGCNALRNVPLFDTSLVTTMSNMFSSCYSISKVPLFNTRSLLNMDAMFQYCSPLIKIPLFNTSSVTSMISTFAGCNSLKIVPLFNTSSVTNMYGLFTGCYSLRTVPLFNTSLVTNCQTMFQNCYSLIEIPLFNFSSVTSTSSMFSACYSLKSLPSFTMGALTATNSMFQSCFSLRNIPLLNTSSCTIISSMFSGCKSLTEIPAMNFGSASSVSTAFSLCNSLQSSDMTDIKYSISLAGCKLVKAELENIFNNLGSGVSSPTITISTNPGIVTVVSLSGTTTVGSTTITMASTTGITTGMQVTGTGTPLTTSIAVTFQDSGDTVTLTAHGLSNDDEVAFPSITSTTGIVVNKIYYVVNKTANTFQVSDSIGGAAKTLTTDGSGTLKYRTEVVSIVPNTSITVSRPATSSATNTLAYRLLKTGTAMLKGWAVTG
jgi:surface protein